MAMRVTYVMAFLLAMLRPDRVAPFRSGWVYARGRPCWSGGTVARHSSANDADDTATGTGTASAANATFHELVGRELGWALRARGVYAPNGMQRDAVPIALAGDDVQIVAQTGSGKTLAFLLPILQRLRSIEEVSAPTERGATADLNALVLAPTTELAAQHMQVARELAPSVTSTGRLHATTPAAFLAEVRAGRLDVRKLEVVAIDEVDAIMCEQGSKGSEFNATLPGVAIELLEVLRGGHDSTAMPPPPQFILATAHLSTAHAQAIAGAFPDAKVVRQASSAGGSASKGVLVPTLKQIFVYFSGGDDAKNGKLLEVIDKARFEDAQLKEGQTLIFCATAEETTRVHAFLMGATFDDGATAVATAQVPLKLHQELSEEERASALAAFRAGESRLLVATDVAARGLDVPSVRHVVLFDMPDDIAAFVHRAGRTARAGEGGVVTCLVRGGAAFGKYKALHALQDAPKLEFPRKCL